MPASAGKARGSSALPAELGAEAVKAADLSVAMQNHFVEQAVRAGELLREAKQRCESQGGSFRDWLRRYWPKSRATALSYIAASLEVGGQRADQTLLDLPSIRALLGPRKKAEAPAEPDGLREPGADEDEDEDDAPGPDGLTSSERATVERIKAGEEGEKKESEAARRQRIEEWREKKRAEERKGLDAKEAARRAAAVAEEAEKRAERERQLDADRAAMKDAEDRKPGPEAPRAKPPAPVEVLTVGPDADAMSEMVLAIQRRWGLVRMEPAPMVEQYGRMVMHPRDEAHAYIAEWVNAGTEVLKHLVTFKTEDGKVGRAIKRAASAVDA